MGQLEIDNLTKRFDDGESEIVAVDDLDITVNDGEFLVLVGPSGCGKSTTLRCIAGLETVTEGKIKINDNIVTDQRPKDRDIAMVFQSYALYPHMTAQENMAFGLKMTTDMPEEKINEQVEKTASMMGIEELLESKPGELSGGQQQRVALGRAIVREPEVFLMDEPLSNLDAKLRTDMRTELQELQQRLDITTVYVTHDQTEAMTMGDRIVILNHGELQQIGTPLECYHSPANQFVAGFIGSPSMNFLDVELSGGNLRHDEFEYDISPTLADKLSQANGDLILGARPEDIQLADTENTNTLTVSVDVIEPVGDLTYVNFTLGNTECTASIDGDIVVDEQSQLELTFPEKKIHIFDRETGESIKNSEINQEKKDVTVN